MLLILSLSTRHAHVIRKNEFEKSFFLEKKSSLKFSLVFEKLDSFPCDIFHTFILRFSRRNDLGLFWISQRQK